MNLKPIPSIQLSGTCPPHVRRVAPLIGLETVPYIGDGRSVYGRHQYKNFPSTGHQVPVKPVSCHPVSPYYGAKSRQLGCMNLQAGPKMDEMGHFNVPHAKPTINLLNRKSRSTRTEYGRTKTFPKQKRYRNRSVLTVPYNHINMVTVSSPIDATPTRQFVLSFLFIFPIAADNFAVGTSNPGECFRTCLSSACRVLHLQHTNRVPEFCNCHPSMHVIISSSTDLSRSPKQTIHRFLDPNYGIL